MPERRERNRFRFGRGYPMQLMDRQGAWQIPCTMFDVSQTGARLHLDAPADGLQFKELILKLAQFGTAQRSCRLIWRRGDFAGVRFHSLPPTVAQFTRASDEA